ncbi:hypothetical protein VZT92_007115 [Zoarces viviparus]|uniref:Uncharacterized protein n=1 Tax=Zoarces viviparus TaxID=48416 RepID=A0AAW1FJD4_ZOAVI
MNAEEERPDGGPTELRRSPVDKLYRRRSLFRAEGPAIKSNAAAIKRHYCCEPVSHSVHPLERIAHSECDQPFPRRALTSSAITKRW